jgi:hypothetical protein
MRRFIVILAFVAAFWPARANALTVRDIVELSRAGLGEETLLALIEVDPSVFPIDTATLKSLKAAGVTERVIVAMVRSARPVPLLPDPFQPADMAPQTSVSPQTSEPQVVVIDHYDPAPQVREVQIAVPVYIPIVRHVRDRDNDHHNDNNDDRRGSADREERHKKGAEPVYWGWGGKLRPDAWQPR